VNDHDQFASACSTLEFDVIVDVVASLAVTPTGHARLTELRPATESAEVAAALKATSEGTRFLASHPGLPLRAPADLIALTEALGVDGRALEATRLVALADYLESIEHSRLAIRNSSATLPMLERLVATVASFKDEIARVRRTIDPAGDVVDNATPRLASLRERLRKQRAKLRQTLEGYLRGRDTSKYLQEQVVTDRHGRYVLVVRAEHRGSIPGIVHGASASGASLYLEPLATVEINNDVVSLEEEEAEEVRRILLMLTDAFRARPEDLEHSLEVATALDVIQAKARLAQITGSIEPALATDGTFELRGARHPLLMRAVWARLEGGRDEGIDPVPVDLLMLPPTRVFVIAGPNTGGKTVALKTAGLLVAMAQAGLHIPVDEGSRLPVFKALFADIGDEQSISASLSTFSAHITNLVSMDRQLELPALVLLDEVGAGTDPVEGGALGVAVIDHFRRRGAHLIATTHYDSLKSYASTTEGVTSAAFGFDPETFAPTYRLIYGSPGRSLAIEIAARLGMPTGVIAAARGNLTDREQQLAEHLARIDGEMRRLEQERRGLYQERLTVAQLERELRAREESVREREATFTKRLNARVEEQVRHARAEIDRVIDGLKTRAAELEAQAASQASMAPRLRRPGLSTGDTGAARADARAALDEIARRLTDLTTLPPEEEVPASTGTLAVGARVRVGGLGLEGTVVDLHGKHAEVDVRGKRLRAAISDLRVIGGQPAPSRVNVQVDLQPVEGLLSELNVIGCTVDEAVARTEKFLDQATVSDQQSVRIIHGHGTGQLRRALGELLRAHPLVAHFALAPQDQGGGGATIVELKG
jgi:DNA mismatch repair protein MutS2